MSKVARFAEVAPAIPLPPTGPQTYTYKLSAKQQSKINPYARVTVPFGHRTVSGVVIRLHSRPALYRTKSIIAVFPAALTSRQVQFARWMAQVSHGGLGYTLRLFQPPGASLVCGGSPGDSPGPSAPSLKPPVALIDGNFNHRCRKLRTIIRQYISQGHQVLILAPEKWMAELLNQQLNNLSPTLIYADLPASHLNSVWQQIRAGQPKLIIGTQKALFLPFNNLKLVVIEEEQYATHKLWDQYPRLHNISGAEQLAYLHAASLLYTSSFSSLRLRHALQNKTIKALVNKPLIPRTSLVKYDFEDKVKRYALPSSFVCRLRKWLKDKDEVLLFYNQRDNDHLKKILNQNHLSSPRLTLSTSAIFAAEPGKKFNRIVWLHPERSLSYPDFRSHERALVTLSRLQQSLSSRQRRIFLVTRRPDTVEKIFIRPPAEAFAGILKERQRFSYPPYTDLVRLTIKAKTKAAAMKRSILIRQQIDRRLSKNSSVKVRGPFHDLSHLPKNKPEVQILLTGSLKVLINIYKNLAVDAADLTPERIL
ncbi:MAG: hypothetical protein ABIH36_03310 [bacterium]